MVGMVVQARSSPIAARTSAGDQGLEVRTPGAVGRNLSADWESNAAS